MLFINIYSLYNEYLLCIIQIMTGHEGNRKIYLARGIQEGLETADLMQLPRLRNMTLQN